MERSSIAIALAAILMSSAAHAGNKENTALILGTIMFVHENCRQWVSDTAITKDFMAEWRTAAIPQNEIDAIEKSAALRVTVLKNLGEQHGMLMACAVVGMKQGTLFDLVTP